MNCLAIDCSSELLGIAVWHDDEQAAAETSRLPKHPYKTKTSGATINSLVSLSIDAGYRHAERLMSAIDFCIKEAGLQAKDLKLLACTGGPGSFTGLRIALATIKGLSLGLKIPFVLVPTLAAWAHEYHGMAEWLIPMLDAKRSQVYAALYHNGKLVEGPLDIKPEELLTMIPKQAQPLVVGPHTLQLHTLFGANHHLSFANGTRQAPLNSLIQLAHAEYLHNGAAASSAGLWYLRASDAEETTTGSST